MNPGWFISGFVEYITHWEENFLRVTTTIEIYCAINPSFIIVFCLTVMHKWQMDGINIFFNENIKGLLNKYIKGHLIGMIDGNNKTSHRKGEDNSIISCLIWLLIFRFYSKSPLYVVRIMQKVVNDTLLCCYNRKSPFSEWNLILWWAFSYNNELLI